MNQDQLKFKFKLNLKYNFKFVVKYNRGYCQETITKEEHYCIEKEGELYYQEFIKENLDMMTEFMSKRGFDKIIKQYPLDIKWDERKRNLVVLKLDNLVEIWNEIRELGNGDDGFKYSVKFKQY